MNPQRITKKALSALLASTLVFSLMPTAAFAAQVKTSSAQQTIEQARTQTDKNDATENQDLTDQQDEDDTKIDEIDLDFEIEDETQKQEEKIHKAKEVDKDKFADPNWVQKEVSALLDSMAYSLDPATFIAYYVGGAIQRGLFALGSGLLDNIGSAFFGGSFSGEEITANKLAFMLTNLDEKAKVVAAESKDLVDLIKSEAKGSIVDDFNAHMNRARGLMLSLKGQYDEIACCNDSGLKASLVAKMNVERERTINLLLVEKAQIDTYILGQSSLSGKNIFQVFDGFADSKYGLNGDSYDIKSKFRAHVGAFMCNMAKYIAIPAGDTRPISPFAKQIENIKQNDKAITSVVEANLPQNIKKTLHFNKAGKDAQIAPLYAQGKLDKTLDSEVKEKQFNKYTTLDLMGFNEDHTARRYFSKGRTIETPTGVKYYVEFYTAGDKNYLIGESFAQKFITVSEFNEALAKKPANIKVKAWIERAAGLKAGECPRYIVLDETHKSSVGGFGFTPCHTFKYKAYDTEKERFNDYQLQISEPNGSNSGHWSKTWQFIFAGISGNERLFDGQGNGKEFRDFIENARILNKIDASIVKQEEKKEEKQQEQSQQKA